MGKKHLMCDRRELNSCSFELVPKTSALTARPLPLLIWIKIYEYHVSMNTVSKFTTPSGKEITQTVVDRQAIREKDRWASDNREFLSQNKVDIQTFSSHPNLNPIQYINK